MKKIVKLFGVMTIAAALLISCKQPTNPDDGTNSDTNTEQTTDKTDAGNTDDKKDDATGDGAGAEEKTPGLEYANVYIVVYDGAEGKQDGKKITLKTIGNYQHAIIELKEPVDFSKGVKVKISVKDFEDAPDANGNYKFVFASEGKIGKDTYGNDAIISKQLSEGYLSITEEAKEVKFNISDAAAWSSDNSNAPADKTKITHIDFNPQKTKGTYVIEFIEPVTE